MAEKLEHSVFLDVLQLILYGWFAYVFYTNFEVGDSALEITLEPNVVAFQLAVLMIGVKLVELAHDRYK